MERLRTIAAHPALSFGVLAGILVLYAVLKLYSLNFVSGDEHMYFYMSLWSSSSDPVHPPNAVTYYLQHESMHAPTIDT